MSRSLTWFWALALSLLILTTSPATAQTLKVGVVQMVIEPALAQNRTKILRFLGEARRQHCDLVVFPELALFWPEISNEKPTKADLDDALKEIGEAAGKAGLYVLLGTSYRATANGHYQNRGVLFGPDGKRLIFYEKNLEVPRFFQVRGVPCNVSICSDRGYLEHSDLPCLMQGSKVIIDISGGHGGDDGRPNLRWIRYRPWAKRTGAYVIVSNPVHHDTDFMGHSPWGGGSAIIAPDGSLQARRIHESDTLIVGEIDTARASLAAATLRRQHPLFKSFWEAGGKLLNGGSLNTAPKVKPFVSAVRDIKIAAVQMTSTGDVHDNVRRIIAHITRAAKAGADVVVFPELAVTGARPEDVRKADASILEEALQRIRQEARERKIHVIAGMPAVAGAVRNNCAVVIGDDGKVLTTYAQLTARGKLFQAGESTRAMWFKLKGVYAIVTIGRDADWVEIGDLAANRGMCLHFHLSNEADPSGLARLTHLVALQYAQAGAVVNARGGSMIVSRVGGHNKPAPRGIEYYLPYQTSIVKAAGQAPEMIVATVRSSRTNAMDLQRYWRNRNRKRRAQKGWHNWITVGAALIHGDTPVEKAP
jgi:predicted amidohydrolase